ncbi:hypothetical protein SLUN_00070 [Streptomyces lunaelactis]|uniref:ParB-like N-terminal domain-containing protein n=1 Tax=Streptomyces lunaelactis TaxID=1535768 RepID=A0A2R4SVK1_9ACTN|nr:ParB/RepB/Spo0J family partition protein [Streptomyces lunaelactis]AVZ70900.1 hypothetical protein SLUN_00070 [Streptomyces lunaelactis]NUK26910.1 ParB N-terminal domain-containing protein [Streptomyces lunaelactis]NUK85633.1 ParB N-terminal domain-containing protein [Streptomyces lunaelactis]
MATVINPDEKKSNEPAPQDDHEFAIAHLDPALLVRDDCNARETDPEPDEKLINSVKELGIQEAVSVRPLPDGTFGVFKGWRRAQSVQQANATAEADGRPQQTAPAYVRPDLIGRDSWTRMLSLIENDQREQMTERDTVKSVELSLIGMNEVEQKQASRALSVRRDAAKDARKAQKLNDATLRRTLAGGMDLEQTAQLADVEEVSGAETRLLRALGRDHEEGKGGRGHWDQELALLREEQASSQARTEAVANLEAAGIPLLRDRFSWGEKDTSRPLTDLTTGLGNTLTEDSHKGCDGHSARLDDEHQPVWHCSDPDQYGHKLRPEAKEPKKPRDEKAAAERRKVIACNRAWKAARGERQRFIATLCRGKNLSDGVRDYSRQVQLTMPWFYGSWAQKGKAADVARFLSAKAPEDDSEAVQNLIKTLARNRDLYAWFAQVAAACEFDIREPKAWASLQSHQAGWLLLLEAEGYTLSEVENQAVSRHRPKTAKASKSA